MSHENQTPLPQYQSHKKVWALKISKIVRNPNGSGYLIFEDARYLPTNKGSEWMEKHNPQPGGYWVQYEDGYESWSPAEAFEKGYTRI